MDRREDKEGRRALSRIWAGPHLQRHLSTRARSGSRAVLWEALGHQRQHCPYWASCWALVCSHLGRGGRGWGSSASRALSASH